MTVSLQHSGHLPLKRLLEKKQTCKNKNFTAKTQYLNFKAPSNNVKMRPDQTITTQIYSFLTIQQMEIFPNEIW